MKLATTLTAMASAFIFAGSAFAQATAPATTTPAPTVAAPGTTAPAATTTKGAKPAKTAKTPAKARSAESLACSKDADDKGLKGKERRSFRNKCMAAAKKAAGGTAVPAKKN